MNDAWYRRKGLAKAVLLGGYVLPNWYFSHVFSEAVSDGEPGMRWGRCEYRLSVHFYPISMICSFFLYDMTNVSLPTRVSDC